jgi:predicted DCC family thiol-disulfide oxidoreductase YuxK
MTTSPATPKLVLLYDHNCPLCRKLAEFVERLDKEALIEIVDHEDEGVRERFPDLNLDRVRQQLTVCDQMNRAWHGVEAIRRITDLLPGLRRFSWIYRLPGVTPAVGGLYRSINRQRKRLCLKCGEKWMPSLKGSARKKRGR